MQGLDRAVSASVQPGLRLRLLLVGLPLAGGAGLVTYILAGVSLPIAILAIAGLGALVATTVYRRLPEAARTSVRSRVVVGVAAGLLATVAYDLARYATVSLFSLSFRPFHIFSLFGAALIGSGRPALPTFAVGFAYHLTNGTFFGTAYVLAIARPRWWSGALFGACLELFMATLYPSWLRIAQFQEFLTVSAVGHLVYGSVLGLTAAALLRRVGRRA